MSLSVPRSGGVKEYRCRYCGAPLRVGPDTVLVVCPYCGKPNWIRGKPSDILVAKAPSADEAREGFLEFAKRDPDLRKLGIEVARIEIVFLPFYEASGKVSGEYDYRGYVVVRKTVKRGDRYVTETRHYPFHEQGSYETGFQALTAAKRVLGEEAADELARHYLETRPSLVRADEATWRRGEFTALGADYDAEEAAARISDDVCDWFRGEIDKLVRREVSSRYFGGTVHVTSRSVTCQPRTESLRGPLLLPLVKVFYIATGKVYRAYFAGWDMAPLLREEPLTGAQRAVIAALSGLVSGGSGVGAVALAASFGRPVEGAILGVVGAFFGYFMARSALRESRVEVGGPGSWVRSLGEDVEEAVRSLEKLEEKMGSLGISIG